MKGIIITMIDFGKLKKKQYPLVSVIVPCYNVEEYIDQCLSSILENGYDNLEVICVDDRSTDSTVEHIKKLQSKHRNIQLYHNELDHNIYGGACRNIGLEHATGKYVYFCDSDDYILPGLFKSCVDRCEKLNAEVCCFGYKKFDVKENEFIIGSGRAFKHCGLYVDNLNRNTFNINQVEHIFKLFEPQVWDKFYLRSFIESIGARFQEIQNSNDVGFFVNTTIHAERITYVNNALYVYRMGTKTSVQRNKVESNDSSNFVKACYCSWDIVKKLNNESATQQFFEFLDSNIRWNMPKRNDEYLTKYIEQITDFLDSTGKECGQIRSFLANNSIGSSKKTNTPNWDIFDKIICIHYLPYRERLDNIKQELSRVGILDLPQFEFYETIDNAFYPYVVNGISKNRLSLKPWNKEPRVDLSNVKYTIDSYNLLKKLEFKGYKRVLILEDDIVFHKNLDYVNKVIESTPTDFDVMNYDPEHLCFSDGGRYGNYQSINNYIDRYQNAKIVNMSCCALSKKAIHHIIKKQHSKLAPFDIYTWSDTGDLNTYSVKFGLNVAIQNYYNGQQSGKPACQKYPVIDIQNYGNYPFKNKQYDVIVSFTTYGTRMHGQEIYQFLDSIVNQKCCIRYHIVCTLFEQDYLNIPEKLKTYFNEHEIEIIVSEFNYRSNLKYIFSMQKYSYIPVITVDDDMVYRDDAIQLLYDSYLKTPSCIIFGRGRHIKQDFNGKTMDYNSWNDVTSFEESEDYMPLGVGGVLYPSKFCKLITLQAISKIIDLDLMTKDDFMLHYLSKNNRMKSRLVECKYQQSSPGVGILVQRELISISRSHSSLWKLNINDNNKTIYLFDKE